MMNAEAEGVDAIATARFNTTTHQQTMKPVNLLKNLLGELINLLCSSSLLKRVWASLTDSNEKESNTQIFFSSSLSKDGHYSVHCRVLKLMLDGWN